MGKWSNETVAVEMAAALGLEPEDNGLEVKDLGGGVDGWMVEDGTREYIVFADTNEAEDYATKQVEADLEDDPTMFNQDWLRHHIYMSDTDRRIIAGEEADSRVEDEEYEDDAARDAAYDEIYEQVYDALEDPIAYFVDDNGIYTVEELMKQSFINIYTKKAAQEAVSTDGVAHFLATYDGDENETDGGLAYYRTN
jgi:hypothetical protein